MLFEDHYQHLMLQVQLQKPTTRDVLCDLACFVRGRTALRFEELEQRTNVGFVVDSRVDNRQQRSKVFEDSKCAP